MITSVLVGGLAWSVSASNSTVEMMSTVLTAVCAEAAPVLMAEMTWSSTNSTWQAAAKALGWNATMWDHQFSDPCNMAGCTLANDGNTPNPTVEQVAAASSAECDMTPWPRESWLSWGNLTTEEQEYSVAMGNDQHNYKLLWDCLPVLCAAEAPASSTSNPEDSAATTEASVMTQVQAVCEEAAPVLMAELTWSSTNSTWQAAAKALGWNATMWDHQFSDPCNMAVCTLANDGNTPNPTVEQVAAASSAECDMTPWPRESWLAWGNLTTEEQEYSVAMGNDQHNYKLLWDCLPVFCAYANPAATEAPASSILPEGSAATNVYAAPLVVSALALML